MTLTVVPVSEIERAQGALSPETNFAGVQALHEQGAVLLRGVFPTRFIDDLQGEFFTRYSRDLSAMTALSEQPPPNPIQNVGEGRFEVALRMNGAFGQPSLFANAILMNFLMPLLGGPGLIRLSGVTAVASFPGAAIQHLHRDHKQLFYEFPEIGPALPLYCVNVSVPLIDIDHNVGPTGIWPGSHRWPEAREGRPDEMVSIPFLRGDCILMDYRTLHTGLPNVSQTVRPILYLVYAREWFFDDNNHRFRAPLDITLDELNALPPNLRLLMYRAYSQAFRVRQLNRP